MSEPKYTPEAAAARAKYDECAMTRSKDLRWYTNEELRAGQIEDWNAIAKAAVEAAGKMEPSDCCRNKARVRVLGDRLEARDEHIAALEAEVARLRGTLKAEITSAVRRWDAEGGGED